MSGAKWLIAHYEECHRVAQRIALRADALAACDLCGGVYNAYVEPKGAYMLGNKMITDGDELVACFEGDRREMTDAVKKAVDESPEECECSRRMREED